MKNLIVISVFFLAYLSSYAQDPQLYENNWFLSNLVINGNNNPAPANSDLSPIYLVFSDTPNHLTTYACDNFFGDLTFDQMSPRFSFSLYDIVFWSMCAFQSNLDYTALYFSFFENEINFPFVYEVSMVNGIRFLSITNDAGDQAFYADQVLLSIEDREALEFGVYPNPFKDRLTLSLVQGEIIELQVYNLLGKEVFQQKGNSQEIYLENLSSGVYFLKAYTDKGITTKKIIKMN